ncbi:MAG: ATP-binding protein [Acutalibacteraceae bacterium]|nr:ATP-binding protein [Acutalibacteraceae bacterium]MEE3374434.1 ATP-binding protein [Acutalibacteraceae bacterium]
MPTNFERAKQVLDRRRETAEREAEQKTEELELLSPELRALNRKLSAAGLKAVQLAITGDQAAMDRLRDENLADQERRREILESLGSSEEALEVHYTCPVCNDTGVVGNHYCDCFKRLVKSLQTENLNAVSPAGDSTFDNFNLAYYQGVTDPETGVDAYSRMGQIVSYCEAYAEDFGLSSPSLILYGNTGLGKTHLSLAIANKAIEKGFNVVYGSAHNLLSEIEKEHFGRLKTDDSPEDNVLNADLLILDDLGAEFSTSFTVSMVYNIINTRILKGLPTIISTNLWYDEISDKYGNRVYSRIIGNYTPLEFAGRDVRQLKN